MKLESIDLFINNRVQRIDFNSGIKSRLCSKINNVINKEFKYCVLDVRYEIGEIKPFKYCVLEVIRNKEIKSRHRDCLCINLDNVDEQELELSIIQTDEGERNIKEVCTEIRLLGNEHHCGDIGEIVFMDNNYFDNMMVIIDNHRVYFISLEDEDGRIFEYLNYDSLSKITGKLSHK